MLCEAGLISTAVASLAHGQRVGVISWGHSVQETRDQKPEAR